eukprot:PLAT6031.1.p2 GENE.PLAT6031.1~~PLAT6031.1.p2  ORF type:complete len:460 (+),score=195.15 PLAT6031.1:67-1380(+)
MGRGGEGDVASPRASERSGSARAAGKDGPHVILYGKSVDVGSFASRHPGGRKVLHIFHNRDATEQFEAFHSTKATKMMQAFLKKSPEVDEKIAAAAASAGGRLSEAEQKRNAAIRKDFRELRETLKAEGLFKTSWVDEVAKALYVLVPMAVGTYMMHSDGGCKIVGALLYALGMQQAGWLGHDYSHHSVFDESPVLNDTIGRFWAWLQGYELQWWKARHNTHHVTTNEVDNDPDVQTAPLLTYVNRWTERLGARPTLNALQKQQHLYFVPLLALLHIYWRAESIMYLAVRPRRYADRLAIMALHYVCLFFVFRGVGWAPFWVAMLSKGVFTGVTVFATHYGEERLPADHSLTLAEQTVRTSRNIAGGTLVDLFTGNISRQVEHHLFPMLPRCNLPKATPLVAAFCKRHDLPFNSDSLWQCVKLNMDMLRISDDKKSD